MRDGQRSGSRGECEMVGGATPASRRAARRWPAVAVEVDVEPVVLVELADEELWLPQAGRARAAMTACRLPVSRLLEPNFSA